LISIGKLVFFEYLFTDSGSTWTEHLCVSRVGNSWFLGEYGYNWAASIYDIPEEDRYAEDGEFNVPDEWEGHKVLGIADGEYIETDELVARGNYIEFETGAVEKAIEFAIEFEWREHQGFDDAIKKLRMIVSEFSPPGN